jgi:raffinose/stachyose/melibiose transport system permease protein
VPTLLIYKRAFVSGDVGSAAAIATILTVLVLVVSVGIRRLEEAGER